jgi:Matrixin
MAFVALLASSALAYTVKQTDTGEPLRWERWPVSYTWTGDGPTDVADAAADVEAAFRAWEQVTGTPIAFEPAPASGTPTEAPDTVNWVWVTEDWPYDPDLLALTSSWTEEDGTIVAFDIRVNGTKAWASDGRIDAYDFRAAMTHEVGHVLGLDHSLLADAVMYATSGMGEPWRADLTADDEEGARFLYPAIVEEAPTSPWGCSSAPAPASLVAAALVGGLRRRARRR